MLSGFNFFNLEKIPNSYLLNDLMGLFDNYKNGKYDKELSGYHSYWYEQTTNPTPTKSQKCKITERPNSTPIKNDKLISPACLIYQAVNDFNCAYHALAPYNSSYCSQIVLLLQQSTEKAIKSIVMLVRPDNQTVHSHDLVKLANSLQHANESDWEDIYKTCRSSAIVIEGLGNTKCYNMNAKDLPSVCIRTRYPKVLNGMGTNVIDPKTLPNIVFQNVNFDRAFDHAAKVLHYAKFILLRKNVDFQPFDLHFNNLKLNLSTRFTVRGAFADLTLFQDYEMDTYD